tara:strand:- start:1313 stop:1432 length:120 start_codon:yes stop_codon:yes gene_type:complete
MNEMSKRVSDKIAHLVRKGSKPKQSTEKKKPANSGSKKY